jgi:DNA mismatch repair ATPase MutS
MEIDKTTLKDLNIFDNEDDFSIFSKINFTKTSNGQEKLKINLSTPLKNIDAIHGIQETLKSITCCFNQWPVEISNGTIIVIERFYEATVNSIPAVVSNYNARIYKLINSYDFSLIKYSVTHCFDLIKGLMKTIELLIDEHTPLPLKNVLLDIESIINKDEFQIIRKHKNTKELTNKEILQLGSFLRYKFKPLMSQLLQMHATIDAWYGMAKSVVENNLIFPEFIESPEPYIKATGLYHILLSDPVPYDLLLNKETNFQFLTGANMAGKSTYIKSVGSAVFLAHTGMGVPVTTMELSVFDGMLSNINVMDDITKGESYFFNEVQRIKATINKISDGRKWLILIDELFKGTNVEDAMKCSSIVIEGLLKIKNSIFILSTHLYEISEALKVHPNIRFNYFETTVINDQFSFSYQLKNGVSNDRLGYLILKKEGVITMLDNLQ